MFIVPKFQIRHLDINLLTPYVKNKSRKVSILKTPCGVTPPPPHFWSSAFHDLFLQVALAGLCLPIFWLILFDLGRSWQIFGDLGRSCQNLV